MNLNEKFHSPSMFGRRHSTIDKTSIPPIPNIYEAIGGISRKKSKIVLWSETNYLDNSNDIVGQKNKSIVAKATFDSAVGTSISCAYLLVRLISSRRRITNKKWDLELMSDKQTRSIL